MGGHGGLNILPQKKWNVYNFDNREKVRKDEEAAAKEEQLKQEQSRRRETEFRLERLRQSRGIASSRHRKSPSPPPSSNSNHINLFEGISGFSAFLGNADAIEKEKGSKRKREEKKKEPVIVSPEDEKYRMGYGVAGKGVKAPWYLGKPSVASVEEHDGREGKWIAKKRDTGKKTIEELREERMKREKREKERERTILASAARERLVF